MNRQLVLKAAISAFALVSAMAFMSAAAEAGHPSAPKQEAAARKQAAEANTKALTAFRTGNRAGALDFAEQAVALAPDDAGYRITLADLYLRNGRFQSAEAAYRDVLVLNPGERHAELSFVLCQIANGERAGALATLDGLTGTVPAADLGLAFALAGQPQRAIAMLEPAAHAADANSRVRQNLAFAYALAGDWQKARVTAAQDISPAELGPRLAQWAALASPSAPSDQVATLLGVRAAADPGLPQRLALAPAPIAQNPVALASADPAPAPVPQAPVALAAADPVPAPAAPPAVAPAPQVRPTAPVRIASASSDFPAWLASPRPAPHAAAPAPVLRHASLDRASIPVFHRAVAHGSAAASGGRFAVQLGAFLSPSALEHAWAALTHRFGFGEKTPLSTTVNVPGRGTFHRLSVAGFASRQDASRACGSIRAKGGACFVRAVAGDVAPQWASRYASRKMALASR
jgi:Flp pilus assembly protein TadD